VLKAFSGFVWFLMQSTMVGGLGFLWFAMPFAIVVATLIWLFIRAEPIEYLKYALLALLPLMWIGVGLWCGYFWADWQAKPFVANPDWVSYPVTYGLWVYLAIALGLIVYLRHLRWFIVLFALLNLYFMLAMSFLGGMAISGDWL
jgi:hypothetical protein